MFFRIWCGSFIFLYLLPPFFFFFSKERFFLEHNSSLVLYWKASRVLTDRPFLVQPSVNLPPLLWQSTLTLAKVNELVCVLWALAAAFFFRAAFHLVRVFSSSFLPMRLVSLSSLLWSLLAYIAARSKLISVIECVVLRDFGNRSGLISGALDVIPKLHLVLLIALAFEVFQVQSRPLLKGQFEGSMERNFRSEDCRLKHYSKTHKYLFKCNKCKST